MRNLLIVLSVVMLASCGVSPEDNALLETQNQELVAKQAQLQADVNSIASQKTTLQSSISNARATLSKVRTETEEVEKTRRALQAGKQPRYILKLKLKQSRFSLDIMKHAKDAMNAITFELPVDEQFYNSVTTGQSIVDNFRSGSFVVNGTWSSWKMTVENKRIIYE